MNGISFRAATLGSVLLVGPSDGVSDSAATLAGALSADPGRQVVVADPPGRQADEAFWSALVGMLRGRGPVRLAVSGAGGGKSGSRAQWLANLLGIEVIAPDGMVLPIGTDMVYVARGGAGFAPGRWISFTPDHAPVPLGPRFPEPGWERQVRLEWLPPALDAAIEPIPAGLWVHGRTGPPDPRTLRPLLDLPVSSDTVTVVLGAPGPMPQESAEKFATLRQALPVLAEPRVRLVSYGNRHGNAIGQELADNFGERVVATIGVPNGRDSRAGQVSFYDTAGRRTWDPFAVEVAYYPRRVGRAVEPKVTRYQAPLADLNPVAALPGVFEFGAGVLLEVVQSGLWLRGERQRRAAEVRSLPADPVWARLTLGVPGEASPDILVSAAATLASRLEPRLRHFLRVCMAGADDPAVGTALSGTRPAQSKGAALGGIAEQVYRGLDQPTEILSPIRTRSAVPPSDAVMSASAPTVRFQSLAVPGPSALQAQPAEVARMTAVTDGAESVVSGNEPTTVVPAEMVSAASVGVVEVESSASPVVDRVAPGATFAGPTAPPTSPEPVASQAVDGQESVTQEVSAQTESLISFPAVDPQLRSTPDERAWLHAHLGQSYGLHLSRVMRLIATQPSLRLLADAPSDAVVADLVAVCAYLADGRAELAEALAADRIETLLPYIHCVLSGLRRLPSYRGATFCGGRVGVAAGVLLPGSVVTEPDIRQAVVTPSSVLNGTTEFLIWSVTARRLESLEPEQLAQRVAFPPGSRFRVLDPGDLAQSPRRVLLRQITSGDARDGLTDDDLVVRDKLTAVVAQRDAVAENDRVPVPDAAAVTWHLKVA